MFEDATFDTRGLAASHTQRWLLLAFTLNCVAVAATIAAPLLSQQSLPSPLFRGVLYTPPERKDVPPKVIHEPVNRAAIPVLTADSAVRRTPSRPQLEGVEAGPPMRTPDWNQSLDDSGSRGAALPAGVFGRGKPTVVQGAEKAAAVKVSKGVSEGLLLHRVDPRYPKLAIDMRMAGTVTLAAIISKAGTIENLQVMSGPAMLRQAAVEAVRQWRYRPYLLNGEAVEVETMIDIHFTLMQ